MHAIKEVCTYKLSVACCCTAAEKKLKEQKEKERKEAEKRKKFRDQALVGGVTIFLYIAGVVVQALQLVTCCSGHTLQPSNDPLR